MLDPVFVLLHIHLAPLRLSCLTATAFAATNTLRTQSALPDCRVTLTPLYTRPDSRAASVIFNSLGLGIKGSIKIWMITLLFF